MSIKRRRDKRRTNPTDFQIIKINRKVLWSKTQTSKRYRKNTKVKRTKDEITNIK